MRKFLFVALTATIFLSCDNMSYSEDDNAKKNLEAARGIANSFGTGDVSAIDSFVADDFVDHTDRGDKVGKDSLKAMVSFVRNNFKDMKMETIHEVADKDYVYQWMRYTGTSDGTMGMPAGPYDMKAIELTKFRDGKAVEHWAFMEMAEMMKMMGMAQPPAQNPTMDTARAADTTKPAP